MTDALHIAVVVLPVAAIMWWRTSRIASAHRRIAEQQEQIEELLKFKADIESLRTRNPYEYLVIGNGLRKTGNQ